MRNSISEFTKKIAPLHILLENVYEKANGRTRRKVSKIYLTDSMWTKTHSKCFNGIKMSIENACALAYPDADMLVCLFTDASHEHWSAVLTQIPF